AMAVGTSWIKELSSAPWDHDADEGGGARRASLSLTVGFLFGAGIAGALAQWAPAPEVLPYLVHVVLTLPVAIVLRRAPDVPRPVLTRIRLRDQLRVPSVRNVRFRRVVAPSAPWVFGCAGVAYAVLPGLASAHVGGLRIAFSALATVVTLGAGVLVQPFARHLDRVGSSRAITVGLLLTAIGMALAAVAAGSLAVPLVLLAACVLGCAYGINLVSGLLEVQRIAEPGDLAGLTAVYYALSYVGFAVPAAMSLLVVHVSYPVMLGVGAVIAAASRWSVVRAQSSR
ncbi:MAG: putative multidrug resistance transporter, superfamily protein, partial [Ilumatobacteraceae bacterium]|nr:putative multidrug resistance transporter, superfamily protein [Ilumatobacteraceae bacterium]